jgi:hypothetical protein
MPVAAANDTRQIFGGKLKELAYSLFIHLVSDP